MRATRSLQAFAVAALAALTPAAAQQPLDTAYTRQILALTSEPRFNTELTDHLSDDPIVPSPLEVLGYVPGTVGRLGYVAEIHRYFRALAAVSPRVKVFPIGLSDEGREMLAVAIADSATIANLDRYRDITRRLADPRPLADSAARALVAAGKPIYYLTGSIHSPETGSPEMLMELAYRLAVEETPILRRVRERVITVITPVVEVDGRDRMVDVYNYGRAHRGVRPPLVYWGRYTAHDNNRDAMTLSQVLTRNVLASFLYWHPQVMHDLHESVPFLYTSTGTGPYNPGIDPITISEWNALAYHEITELTKRGLPGVWTHGFYDGWAPNYLMFIANMRNAIGRFYETFTAFGAECDTARVGAAQRSVEWYRPNPPLDGVRWCIRNNINYQQSGVILALQYVADNAPLFLENFWLKSKRAVERGRTRAPFAWLIPATQPRRVEAGDLVNLLRRHEIEVHRADRSFSAGSIAVQEGDYLVRMDQPYGPLAASLLGTQSYRPTDPRPYDDTGWTLGALRGVAVQSLSESGVLAQPMSRVESDVAARGSFTPGAGTGAYLVPATTETNLIVFRYRLREYRMYAAEDSFTVERRSFLAGTVIVPTAGAPADADRAIRAAADSLGLALFVVRAVPGTVPTHELDLPRIGLVHSWQNTQNEGWVRYAFDRVRIPYTYLSTQELRDSSALAALDVLVLPYITSDHQSIVNGMAMAGPPIPWRTTSETPNLGRYDETDDVRPGIGLAGLARLDSWIRAGGLLITEGGTTAVPIAYGMARGMAIVPASQLRAPGVVARAEIRDRKSPVVYGYTDTLAVYFNQSPLFRVDTTTTRGSERERDSTVLRDLERQRPRVLVRFHHRADSLLVSGLLEAGAELAGRPAVVDVPAGAGHMILLAIRPFWRWQTQASFALVFNAILNWNDLDAGRGATPPRAAVPAAAGRSPNR